jgi:hypothetical protein
VWGKIGHTIYNGVVNVTGKADKLAFGLKQVEIATGGAFQPS